MRESILIRIASDPIARVWSGVGDLLIPADYIEPGPAVYLGGGELINAPDIQALIGGIAARVEITLSGVSADVIRLAFLEAESVKGANVDIGTIRFGPDWQISSPVVWEGRFRADTLTTSRQPSDQGASRTITLSIGTDNTSRSRAPIAFFTDADQRRRSPDDKFFDHVAGISGGTSRRFGPT